MALELKLYDTLTREKRVFIPLDPANVRMYVCGPTVYDLAHIGNARPVIVFDVLFRLLRHVYGEACVKYVRNITDVDDKINARAAERGVSIRDLTEETYQNFKRDVAALGCLPPTVEPRATEHIEQMKTLIERLVADGHAYVAEDNVLFNVPSMTDYGRLSKRPMDEMIAGARVEVAPYKKDAQDFILWKPSKPGEPGWPSPAGIKTPGRPGWHIECSAMAWQHLGETFDIHGGGIDLVFPHHENEIAQSRCAFSTSVMANYWMHNGFLQVEGEKMSKSLGNFVTIRELLTGWEGTSWPGNVVRLAMIDSHYRQPINWTFDKLSQSDLELFRFTSKMIVLSANYFSGDWQQFSSFILNAPFSAPSEFLELLCDDLNTPAALSYIRHRYSTMDKNPNVALDVLRSLELLGIVSRERLFANKRPGLLRVFDQDEFRKAEHLGRTLMVARLNGNAEQLNATKRALEEMSIVPVDEELGSFYLEKREAKKSEIEEMITRLIAERNAARKAKNFAESDRIRDELAGMGVVLKDSKDGTIWEIAR